MYGILTGLYPTVCIGNVENDMLLCSTRTHISMRYNKKHIRFVWLPIISMEESKLNNVLIEKLLVHEMVNNDNSWNDTPKKKYCNTYIFQLYGVTFN